MKKIIQLKVFFALICSSLFCANNYAETNWQTFNDGINIPGRITAINMNSQSPQTMYAGTFFGGLYESTDHAKHWFPVASSLFEGNYLSEITINPINTNEVYVTTEKNGILKSTDNIHWAELNPDLKKLNPSYLRINPQNPNEMYTISFFDGLYKTIDAGKNWNILKNGLEKVSYFGRLAINPVQPNILFFQAWIGFDAKLYKSTNSGKTWSLVPSVNFYVYSVHFAPDNSQFLYVTGSKGLFRSVDGGTTWQLIFASQDKQTITTFAIDKNNPKIIYLVISQSGIFKTEDGGTSWKKIFTQTDENEYARLNINPMNSNELYFTPENKGIIQSQDGGLTWRAIDDGLFNAIVLSITSPQQDANTVYAGTALHGLWMMRDGKTWTQSDTSIANFSVTKIIIDPLNAANLVLLLEKNPHAMYADIYYSHDFGEHWTAAKINLDDRDQTDFIPTSLAYNPTDTKEVFAGDYRSNIWKSIDGGESWNLWSTVSIGFDSIENFTFNVKNPKEMFVGSEGWETNRVVYKSSDGGKNWAQLKFEFGKGHFLKLYAMTMDPYNPQIMYAAAGIDLHRNTLHLYKTEDGGKNWQTIDKGLPDVILINTIIIDPNDTKTLYVATGYYHDSANLPNGDGIYVSHDAGETWQAFNQGLNNLLATAFTLNHNRLFVGTEGSGVYTRTL